MHLRRFAIAVAAAGAGMLPVCGETYTDAYGFLDIPTSSHVYALGGSNVCVIDDDVTLTDQNPALLGPEIDMQIAANYMLYLGTSNFAGVRYGMAAGESSAWAIGMRYLNFGSIEGYDEFGTPTGVFTPQDLVVEGTYSRDISGRWRGGVNLKMAYSSYEQYTALALAADLGVNYYDEERDLSFSVVLRNMGGQVKRFASAYNRVPFDVRIGWMQGLGNSGFSLSVTADHLTRWRLPYYEYNSSGEEQVSFSSGFFGNFFRHLVFGAQYQPSEKFYLALGYNYKTRTDMASFNRNILSGFSAGAGFRVRGLSLGVAYAMPCKSGSSLVVNISCPIGELLE